MGAMTGVLYAWATAFVAFAVAMLVQSAILILLLLAVDRLVRHRVRPAILYAIWMLALAKLLLPPTLASPTSVAYWLMDARPVDTPAHPLIASDMPAATDLPPPVPRDADVPESPRPPQREVSGPPFMNAGVIALFTIWLAGVGVLVAGVVHGSLRARRLVRTTTDTPSDLLELVDGCRRELRVRRRIDVRCTPFVHAPALYGLWRAQILVPSAVVHSFSRTELRAVLLHEVAHCRRWDVWVNALQVLVQIAYWYNPLLWVADARIRHVREQAVDEIVRVHLRAGANAYPEVLLRIARMTLIGSRRPRIAYVGMLESGRGLTQRIERMLRLPVASSAWLDARSRALILVAAIVLLPMARAVVPASEGPVDLKLDDEASRSRQPETQPASGAADDAVTPPVLRSEPELLPSRPLLVSTQQAPTVPAIYDTATVVLHVPEGPGAPVRRPGGLIAARASEVAATDVTLAQLIAYAYEIRWGSAVVGGPEWVRTARYDVHATTTEGLSDARRRLALQGLLRDRFGLRVSPGPVVIQGYALVLLDGVTGLGSPPYLVPRPDGCRTTKGSPVSLLVAPQGAAKGSQCGALAHVTRFASREMEAPVVDKTGVTGDWDIQFYWAPTYPIRWPWAYDSPTGVDPSLPPFREALEQQLGLTIVATAPATADGLVIDAARQP